MFRQYQDQEFAGSGGAIRTISGVSESSEATTCINGSLAEETAPSTVIELTVDGVSQKSLDSASNSTLTSRPRSDSEDREPASITVSNILGRDEDKEQKGAEENSSDGLDVGKENEVAVIEMTNSKEPDSAPSRSDDPAAESDDKKPENKDASSSSEAENPPEKADEAEQTSSEPAASLENSGAGGASIFNEDLVDMSSVSDQVQPSDADDSLEESYVSAATGEEGEVGEKAAGEADSKRKSSEQGEEEVKSEEQSENQESMEQEKVDEKNPCLENENTSIVAPQQSDAGAPKEDVGNVQSSSDTDTKDQQPSDTTPTSSSQEAPDQPSKAGDTTTAEETQSAAPDSNTSSSDTPRSPDSHSKTKEIKIARLDVSNVASDTRGLELKDASSAVRVYFLFPKPTQALCELNPVLKLSMFFGLVGFCRTQTRVKQLQQHQRQEVLQASREKAARQRLAPPCSASQNFAGPTCTSAFSPTCSSL